MSTCLCGYCHAHAHICGYTWYELYCHLKVELDIVSEYIVGLWKSFSRQNGNECRLEILGSSPGFDAM